MVLEGWLPDLITDYNNYNSSYFLHLQYDFVKLFDISISDI